MVLLVNLPFAAGALMYAYEALFGTRPAQPLSRQTAWGCLTTNLAVPASARCSPGAWWAIFKSFYGGRFCADAHLRRSDHRLVFVQLVALDERAGRPIRKSGEIWAHFRWPLLGIAIFIFVILWALTTSLSIVAESRAAERRAKAMRPLPRSFELERGVNAALQA